MEKKTSALIGYTGFVGRHLALEQDYTILVNSQNIDELRGRHFHRIVCAGARAEKWKANQDPVSDLANIKKLIDVLSVVSADEFVLISTVDVFAVPVEVAESAVVPREHLHAYGLHRLFLESFVRGRFPRHHILRLPGLFGRGLKKNMIYDLLNDNNVALISPDSYFQWYPVYRITQDINRVRKAGLSLAHLATEPITTRIIIERFFPERLNRVEGSQMHRYDMRTLHGSLFGGDHRYAILAEEILCELGAYIDKEKAYANRIF